MATIREMRDRWLAVDVSAIGGQVMDENKEQIIALNTSQLYDKGVDSGGLPLPAYKSAEYAKLKESMRGFAITDGYLTGAFQSKFALAVNQDKFSLTSTDEKTDMLEHKKGWSGIFGLTNDSKQAAWSGIMRNPFVQVLAEKTGSKIG